jgi:hypothetical protein
MKKGDVLRRGEVVKIIAGKRSGAVGVVVDISPAQRVEVAVSGILNGETVDFAEWFALSSLGRNEP